MHIANGKKFLITIVQWTVH